jgi:hypothetical protein
VLPDICGKAEYPTLKTAERYKKWYQEYVGQYEQSPYDRENDTKVPYLSDNVVYQLRCSLLHQGNPNVEKNKTGIDSFKLMLERKNEFDMYVNSASFCRSSGISTCNISVRRLCLLICESAEAYYNKHKENFSFFNYTILKKD